MINTETVALTALITQIWPSMKLNAFSADAWHPILEDLPYDVAERAVLILAKSHPGYIQPYDIRHQAAKDAGLLAIDEGTAFNMAAKVGLNSGDGARMLPGPIQDAYWQMGGAPAFEGDTGMVRSRWNKVYAACCEKRHKELLAGDLGSAIHAAHMAALIKAGERIQLRNHAEHVKDGG